MLVDEDQKKEKKTPLSLSQYFFILEQSVMLAGSANVVFFPNFIHMIRVTITSTKLNIVFIHSNTNRKRNFNFNRFSIVLINGISLYILNNSIVLLTDKI